jgi:hypothetical protein
VAAAAGGEGGRRGSGEVGHMGLLCEAVWIGSPTAVVWVSYSTSLKLPFLNPWNEMREDIVERGVPFTFCHWLDVLRTCGSFKYNLYDLVLVECILVSLPEAKQFL